MAQVINKRSIERSNKVDKSKLQDLKKITPKSNLVTLRSAAGEKRVNSTKTVSKNAGRVAKKKTY